MQTSLESLVSQCTSSFEACMTQVVQAYSATQETLQMQKQPAPDALALENQQLCVQVADLRADLALSETKLASQQANQTVEHLRR